MAGAEMVSDCANGYCTKVLTSASLHIGPSLTAATRWQCLGLPTRLWALHMSFMSELYSSGVAMSQTPLLFSLHFLPPIPCCCRLGGLYYLIKAAALAWLVLPQTKVCHAVFASLFAADYMR